MSNSRPLIEVIKKNQAILEQRLGDCDDSLERTLSRKSTEVQNQVQPAFMRVYMRESSSNADPEGGRIYYSINGRPLTEQERHENKIYNQCGQKIYQWKTWLKSKYSEYSEYESILKNFKKDHNEDIREFRIIVDGCAQGLTPDDVVLEGVFERQIKILAKINHLPTVTEFIDAHIKAALPWIHGKVGALTRANVLAKPKVADEKETFPPAQANITSDRFMALEAEVKNLKKSLAEISVRLEKAGIVAGQKVEVSKPRGLGFY